MQDMKVPSNHKLQCGLPDHANHFRFSKLDKNVYMVTVLYSVHEGGRSGHEYDCDSALYNMYNLYH